LPARPSRRKDGALSRLLDRLDWQPDLLGAAGTGKTTVARLPRRETDLAFRADFGNLFGVADCRRFFDGRAPRAG